MNQFIIPILTFVSVSAIGGAIILARAARRHKLRVRLEEFGDITLDTDHKIEDEPGPVLKTLERVGRTVASRTGHGALQERLAHAGFFSPAAPMVYTGARMIMLVIGVLLAAALAWSIPVMFPIKIMIVIAGGFILSLIPSLYVDLRKSSRSLDIQNALPDAVDLLEICVSSGMGLDMAWNAVSDEIRRVSPILADEMALTNLEIHLGADRAKAMRHMAKRTGSEEINALVGTLVQSERFGTPIADALKVFAESMRDARHTRAAEAAEKMGLKMLFPMIVFILPSILIVMGGAAIIKIMNMFDSL